MADMRRFLEEAMPPDPGLCRRRGKRAFRKTWSRCIISLLIRGTTSVGGFNTHSPFPQ